MRHSIVILSSLLLVSAALAQEPRRARRRAPPAPDQNLPVRQPAVLDAFVPESGPPGSSVMLRGRNFDETTQIRFNGRWLPISSRTGTELRVTLPPHAASDRFIVVKAGFPELQSDRLFNVVRPPVIAGFSPAQGGPGTEVTVIGAHFLPGDRLFIGDRELAVLAVQPTRIVGTVPTAASSNRLGIRREDRIAAWSRIAFQVTGLPPVILGFRPDRGPRGTMVRITGRNFEPSDSVELGGQRVDIRARSPHHLDVVIGNQSTGRLAVVGSGRRAEASDTFTVVKPLAVTRFSPPFGPPGTRITVEGTGFETGDAVHLNQAMLTVRTVTENTIIADLPAGVESGLLYVQRGSQKAYARARFEVLMAPVISNVLPSAGPPGATVTIHGRNFLPDVSAVLSGVQLPILRRRLPEELTVQIPPGARTGPLVVVTRAGSAQSPIPFRVAHYAELASFFPLHALPGTRVTLRGANFHHGMRVALGDVPLHQVQRTETELTVEIPAGARSGYFQLESYGRKTLSRMAFTVDEPRPEVEFTFAPAAGARGSEVTLTLTPPRQGAAVFFDGRPLPVKELQGGRTLIVTIPSDGRTGYFELELNGQRYRAPQPFRVR